MVPASREQFKLYCLRKLGHPVIEINVEDDQLEDRIDEALIYFMDYHFEGSEKTYYKYPVTLQDITNRYITMPENVIGVVNLFPIGQSLNTNNLFNIRYQIALNDLYTLTSVSMVPYYMALQHIQFLEIMLVGQQPIRYNRAKNLLYIDTDWNLLSVGDYIIVEAYQVVDPNVYTKCWSDRWLLRYGTCLFKQQWARHLTKYKNLPLAGGVIFNGEEILKEALLEQKDLEYEMVHSWSLPSYDAISPGN